ncbi:MAG: serine/threonine-protein kinase [Pirellulales bacterium]
MKPETADNLLQLAVELDLVAETAAEEALREAGGGSADVAGFGQTLVRHELLTGYQLERLLRGDTTGYFYGRAKILYQIGAGSFARVYRAIHRDTGGILAVKVLRSRFSADAAKQAAFQREGEMGRTLRHPHIVAVEDVGQEGGATYITLEFVEGQTLRQLVKIRGALDLPRALDLIRQLLTGLDYAHRRGVTHRDLKSSNVIVSATGVAKLVDFGLAGVDEPGERTHTRSHHMPRTVDYAALEKLAGVRDDDVRSDIYFLGTVAYLALCGQPALEESRDRSVRSDPRRFTIVQPLASRDPQLPRDVVDFVGRMMHLDPQQRFQTAGEALRAIEPIIAKHAAGGGDGQAAGSPAQPGATPAATRGSLMLVESAEQAQQKLRDFFTKLGYRVLLTENPQRALARFSSTPLPANCLVISTLTLGDCALEAFNQLTTDPFLAPVPAVLLVNSKQQAIADQARTDALRKVAVMPIGGTDMLKLVQSVTTLPG